MIIIAWRVLRDFASQPGRRGAMKPLKVWRRLMEASDFAGPNELKRVFGKASILKSGKVVFDIGGNKYRLVVWIAYRVRTVFVKWIGTHEDYDKLDLD